MAKKKFFCNLKVSGPEQEFSCTSKEILSENFQADDSLFSDYRRGMPKSGWKYGRFRRKILGKQGRIPALCFRCRLWPFTDLAYDEKRDQFCMPDTQRIFVQLTSFAIGPLPGLCSTRVTAWKTRCLPPKARMICIFRISKNRVGNGVGKEKRAYEKFPANPWYYWCARSDSNTRPTA